TIFVRNLPYNITDAEFKSAFEEIGPLKRGFIVKDKDNQNRCRGFGYVTFALEEDALKAKDNIKSIKGRPIHLDFSEKKARTKPGREGTVKVKAVIESKDKSSSPKGSKKSRLIIRNLAFNCTEAILKETFSAFGEVSEASVPQKKVGRRNRKMGFGFVQFTNVFDAAKALEEMNAKKILGRPVAVDWAVPKSMYTENQEKHKKDYNSNTLQDDEKGGEDLEGTTEHKNRDDDDDDSDDDEDVKHMSKDDNNNEKSDEDDASEDDNHSQRSKPSDVKEGLTVFIRNLSFDSTQKNITNLFKQFGDIAYCKVVVDHLTQHSKGSAFVKYRSAESVTQCLAATDEDSEGLFLDGNRLQVDLAVTPGKLEQMSRQQKEERRDPKDKRNLYLAREGVIKPGSDAAKDLSKADLLKRQKAEAEKKSKLQNPNYFVSKTRLCARNLPLKLNEKELSKVFSKAGTLDNHKPAKVVSVLLMRSKERLDSSGKGRPLGFAFVEFTNHKEALAALRATNNNPELFGPDRRPIVEFSIENSVALKAKQQRQQRNKQKHKQMESQSGQDLQTNKEKRLKKRERRIQKRKEKQLRRKDQTKNGRDDKTGSNASETASAIGDGVKGEQKSKKDLSKKSKPQLNISKPLKKTFQSGRSAKRKAREQKEESEFNTIVQNYKNKLFGESGATKEKRARWFE
ncbi:predicted protein, partial [Nematostella vectensis]